MNVTSTSAYYPQTWGTTMTGTTGYTVKAVSNLKPNKEKAVVIFSGGADSITLLHLVKAMGYEVYGMSFDYGQRHKKELNYAKYWGRKLCKEWELVDLEFMRYVASNSALTGDKKVPHEHYTNENQKITVVPNRNMVMLSIAIAWAENLRIGKVFYAPHANDKTIYPDCRKEFVEALSKASQLGTYRNVEVVAPFVDMYKWQLIYLGNKLGVDYKMTWSCYEGKKKHCGKCGTCQERIEAFQIANITDPTTYEV